MEAHKSLFDINYIEEALVPGQEGIGRSKKEESSKICIEKNSNVLVRKN